MVALAHGTNDAQKTMGIITLTLITAGVLAPNSGPPFWVILSAGLAIALGTYMGGWRIIQTLGKRVSDIQTPQGFAAETSAATVILASSHLGFALSTTQVATGAIFGAGAGRRLASVQWGVAGQMALAWLLTLPAAAVVGAVAAWVAGTGTVGTVIVARGPDRGRGRHLRRVAARPGQRPQRQRRPGPRAGVGRRLRGATMGIAWGSLFIVCVVSLAVGVAVVALVAFALVGLSARAARAGRRPGRRRADRQRGGRAPRSRACACSRRRPSSATGSGSSSPDRRDVAKAAFGALNAPNAAFAASRARVGLRYGARHDRGGTARFGAVEAGGTKFVCLLGSSPDDIVARTRIPTGDDPARTLAAVVDFFAEHPAPAAVGIASFGPVELRPGPPALRPHHLDPQARLARRRPRRADPARRWASRSASTPTSRAPRSARAAGVRRRGCARSST